MAQERRGLPGDWDCHGNIDVRLNARRRHRRRLIDRKPKLAGKYLGIRGINDAITVEIRIQKILRLTHRAAQRASQELRVLAIYFSIPIHIAGHEYFENVLAGTCRVRARNLNMPQARLGNGEEREGSVRLS